MYRRPSKRQIEARARKLEAMRRSKDRARMARPAQGRMPDLPNLRREVIVIDYDTGQPVTHTLHLYKTRRIDSYRAEADGQPWKDRIGWSEPGENSRTLGGEGGIRTLGTGEPVRRISNTERASCAGRFTSLRAMRAKRIGRFLRTNYGKNSRTVGAMAAARSAAHP